MERCPAVFEVVQFDERLNRASSATPVVPIALVDSKPSAFGFQRCRKIRWCLTC